MPQIKTMDTNRKPKLFPDIVKGSQLMDQSKIILKKVGYAKVQRKIEPGKVIRRGAPRKPVKIEERPPFCVQNNSAKYFSVLPKLK